MKLILEEYSNKASVPHTKVKGLFDVCDGFFCSKKLDKHEFLEIRINTMLERNEYKVIGSNGNRFILEFHYPNSTFKELLIVDRIELYKNMLISSISSYLESINIDVGIIDELRANLVKL